MAFLTPYLAELFIGLAVIVVIQMFMLMSLNSRMNRIGKLMRSLFTGPQGEDLESLLTRCLSESARALERNDELDASLAALAEKVRGCVQHVGIVRYDAFGDASGQQSFSLALLDARQNGAIITGLFGRMDSRIYGKPVDSGRTEQALTEEESTALELALQGGGSTSAAPITNNNGRRRADRVASAERTVNRDS